VLLLVGLVGPGGIRLWGGPLRAAATLPGGRGGGPPREGV